MSNLHAKIFAYYTFKGKSVGQMSNGYINASALSLDLEQLFAYAVASKGDSYICLIARDLELSPKDLIIVYRNDYWIHPKIAPHFAMFLGDEHLSFVLDCLCFWVSATQQRALLSSFSADLLNETFRLESGKSDVCEFLRRCYRLSCEEVT